MTWPSRQWHCASRSCLGWTLSGPASASLRTGESQQGLIVESNISIQSTFYTGFFQDLYFQLELWRCCGNIPRSEGCWENSPWSICEVNKLQSGIFADIYSDEWLFQRRRSLGFLLATTPCKLAHLHIKRRWNSCMGVISWTLCIVVMGADACLWYHQTLFHHFVILRNHSAFCHNPALNTLIWRFALAFGHTRKHMTKVKVSLERFCLRNLSISRQCINICA